MPAAKITSPRTRLSSSRSQPRRRRRRSRRLASAARRRMLSSEETERARCHEDGTLSGYRREDRVSLEPLEILQSVGGVSLSGAQVCTSQGDVKKSPSVVRRTKDLLGLVQRLTGLVEPPSLGSQLPV